MFIFFLLNTAVCYDVLEYVLHFNLQTATTRNLLDISLVFIRFLCSQIKVMLIYIYISLWKPLASFVCHVDLFVFRAQHKKNRTTYKKEKLTQLPLSNKLYSNVNIDPHPPAIHVLLGDGGLDSFASSYETPRASIHSCT